MEKRISTADRVLAVLGLFSTERPEWTVEEIRAELGLSSSTAYEYVGSLIKSGLLVSGRNGRCTIGPGAIELDRVARLVDPLTRQARSALRELVRASGAGTIGLLCRLYRLRVMCVDQSAVQAPAIEISYERGRPMPLTRGSASKVILANLESRQLRRFYDQEAEALRAIGLGQDWPAFRDEMRAIRRDRSLVCVGELDPGAMGISAPVFGEDDAILGSIGLVLDAEAVLADPPRLAKLKSLVEAAGEAVTQALRAG